MDCTEARHLIDQGVAPGPRTPLSTQLGFHLARCAACRAYRVQQATFLSSLLLDQMAAQPAPTQAFIPPPVRARAATTSASQAAHRNAPPTAPQRQAQRPRLVWYVGTALMLLLVTVVVWFGGILVRAMDNIASYSVSTATALPRIDEPTRQRSAGGVAPGGAGELIAARPLDYQQPPPDSETNTVQPTDVSATPQPSATTQPTARVIITATPWSPVVTSAPVATPTTEPQPPAPGEPFTVLILGNDRRPGETGVPRTDAVMLARIDPQRGRVALLSFPRDMWVTIPGYGQNRINAAYVWGEIYGAEGGGLGLAKATVSNLIGRQVDYVMMIDFTGFIGLIDSIGGVTVNVEKELDDPSFPTMDYGYMHAYFAPGPQHMDGTTALIYSRIRHPDSDFARVTRQQAVLVAIGERLHERGDFQNLVAADTITGALRGYVQTDMPQERILPALWALRGLQPAQVERWSFDGNSVSVGIGGDRYALVPLPGVTEALAQRLYGE